MLPPGVQIHQPPQSRTTFLYVTSKLPQVSGSSSNPSNTCTNGSDSRNAPIKTSLPRPTDLARDKFLRQSASIRDKVLASIEMFGYGLSGEAGDSATPTDFPIRPPKGVQITPVSNVGSSGCCSFGRGKYEDATVNRNTMSGAIVREGQVSITPVPENLTNYAPYSRQCRDRTREPYSPYSPSPFPIPGQRERSRSPPENSRGSYHFGSGGVLALALTRGSKAVVNQLPFSVSMTPVKPARGLAPHTPPLSNPESPTDLCIDFSRRSGSVSPRNNGFHSPASSTTPRSTPGLSESAEDIADEYHPLLLTQERKGLKLLSLGKEACRMGAIMGQGRGRA